MCGVTIVLRMGYVDTFCGGFLNDFSRLTVLNVGFRFDRMTAFALFTFQIFGVR